MTTPEVKPSEPEIGAIVSAAGSDPGRVQQENQDITEIHENGDLRLYLLADGVSGGPGGAKAAKLALDHVLGRLKDLSPLDVNAVEAAIAEANAIIFEQASADSALSGMGTTIALCAIDGTHVIVANVGDSRVYRLRDGAFQQLTHDHTLLNELIRSGTISAADAQGQQMSNMLTRSLGPTPEVEVECSELPDQIRAEDRYLLCSDGLYNSVSPERMAAVLTGSAPADVPRLLIEAANQASGAENVSLIVIAIEPVRKPEAENPPPDGTAKQVQEQAAAAANQNAGVEALPTPVPGAGTKESEAKPDAAGPRIKLGDQAKTKRPAPPPKKDVSHIIDFMRKAVWCAAIGLTVAVAYTYGTRRDNSPPPGPAVSIVVAPPLNPQISSSGTNSSATSQLTASSAAAQSSSVAMPSSAATIDDLKADSERTTTALATASEQLNIWLDLRNQLSSRDPIDLARIVAERDAGVKAKQNSFQQATWEFLQAGEAEEANPKDAALHKRTEELAAARTAALNDLTATVRSVISAKVDAFNKEVGDLTFARDRLSQALKDRAAAPSSSSVSEPAAASSISSQEHS